MTTTTTERAPGRIITFYSYKGGTGRTMALANVGWILAAAGRRVLLIDWDLEAPGLHRYLHPFLEDKELAATPGLIDLFVDFAAAARIAKTSTRKDERWFESAASVLRYAVPIEADFGESGGSLDFVPAGRQDAGYALRANTFDWQEFYDALGGGIFLEALKQRLRRSYEFILIDSRTGLSDTSGICTVQMPDELVVLFTLNQQSIKGAYAIAESAEQQRLKPTGEPALRIWPVPTRVEHAEKERLDAARDVARATFRRFIKHLPRSEREEYWGSAEIMYQPYYAYEEVLATFADRPGLRGSMLSAMETLAGRVGGGEVSFRMTDSKRKEIRTWYQRSAAAEPERPLVYVSFTPGDALVESAFRAISRALRALAVDTWPPLGHFESSEKAFARSSVVVVLVANETTMDQRREMVIAREAEKFVIPVMIGMGPEMPFVGRVGTTVRILGVNAVEFGAYQVMNEVRSALDKTIEPQRDPDDRNRGRFGGRFETNGRRLSALISSVSEEWFRVRLMVAGKSLEGEVEFHLEHDVRTIKVEDGVAICELGTWGAFTVGAIADGGKTRLELDLAALDSAPPTFRER